MAKKKKVQKMTGVMAKWGKIKWQNTSKKVLPIENDLSIDYSVDDKNKKEARTISFSYIPKATLGNDVKKEVDKWYAQIGKVHPLYIGKKRFGAKRLKLKSVNVSNIEVYGQKMIDAEIKLNFIEKKGKVKKTSKKKVGKTNQAKKTTKKKAKSK